MERRSFLAILSALLLAPFLRAFERFKPKPKLRGFSFDYNKLSFDPNEPFSVSMWFTKPSGDCRYLFESTSTTKISETTLLDDITDDEWHRFEVEYNGSLLPDPQLYIDGRRPTAAPWHPRALWNGSSDVAGDDAKS